jgi:hypothetical protein
MPCSLYSADGELIRNVLPALAGCSDREAGKRRYSTSVLVDWSREE